MYWDTHAHINMLDNPSEVIQSFQSNQLFGAICPAVDYKSSLESIALSKAHPGIIGAAVGVHPNEESEHPWEDFIALAEQNDLWAIGETGLDYYRDYVAKDTQKNRFIQHIELAKSCNLPLIVHLRQSAADVIDILQKHAAGVTTILHSFTEDDSVAQDALQLGCYISLSGIVTFKNAQALRDTAQKLPLNRILIETDTPYLSPEPFRGRTNHPKNVAEVAKTLADLHQIKLEDFSKIIHSNTKDVFTKIPAQHEIPL